jgi:hypothetical protein
VTPGHARRAGVLLLAAGALGAAAGAGAASPPGPTWVLRKPIALPALAAPAWVEARLDAEVYRDATPSLRDLRVRDGSGSEVPYLVRRHEKPRTWQERELPPLDLQRTARGEVRFVLDLGPAPGLHNRVRIRFADAARNFLVPARVETSADRRGWQLVREAGFVYLVEGETPAAGTTVGYPPSTARYLRVTLGALPGPAIPVTGAAVIAETPAVRGEETVPAQLVELRERPERRATELLLDLGGRRPVDRAELVVADATFHRVVVVEASDDRAAWRRVASGAVSAVEGARHRERETVVAFPETAVRYLRLTIHNRDDRPLRVSAVRLGAVRRGAVFQAIPGQSYALEYGDPARPAPSYDLARTFPFVEAETLPVATLGPAARVALPAPEAPWTERRPVVLWGAMAVVAVALAGLLVRLARQVPPPVRPGDR